MHCSSCGKALIPGLSYCNHCGTKLGSAQEHGTSRLPEATQNLLLAGILGVPIAGLGIIIGLMSVMKKELGFSNEVIFAFTLLSFLLLLAAEGVFIWMLIHRTRTVEETSDNARLKEVVTKVLGEAQARGLSESIPSVTENTTRTLEPMYRESKTQ